MVDGGPRGRGLLGFVRVEEEEEEQACVYSYLKNVVISFYFCSSNSGRTRKKHLEGRGTLKSTSGEKKVNNRI